MHRRIHALLFMAVAIVLFSCSQNKAELSGAALADLTARAKEVVTLFAQEDFSGAAQYFDDNMKKGLPPDKLREVWATLTSQAGPFQQQIKTRSERAEGFNVIFVSSAFENAKIDIKIVFNDSQQIAGLFFIPGS